MPKLQMLLTLARFHVYHSENPDTGTTFLEYDKLTAQRYTFMVSTKTEMTKEFHSSLPNRKEKPRLAISIQLGFVGNSSLSSVAHLFCRDTKEVYVTNQNMVVTVDKVTRKPVPLPEWWTNKYRPLSVESQRLIIPSVPVPDEKYVTSMKALWSDMDAYRHTNYVAYIRYCFEAAMEANATNRFSKFTGDMLHYYVKSMDILYKGESTPGDELKVSTWENKDNPYLIHFDINKAGKTIFQSHIQYFEQD